MATIPKSHNEREALAALAKHIELAIEGMRFGSVEIVVHAGRVMQIERRDKYSCPPIAPFDLNRP